MKKVLMRMAWALLGLGCLVCVEANAAAAPGDEIQLSTDVLRFDGDYGTKEVKVLKGKKYELFSYSDWMTCTQRKDGTLEITTKPYNFFYPRQASVILTSKKTNYSKVLTVIQTDGSRRPEVAPRLTGKNLLLLNDMDLSKAKFYYIKEIHKNKSVDNHPIKIKATRYEQGIATHAPSTMIFRLNGAKRFQTVMSIDDEIMSRNETVTHGHAAYEVLLDGKKVKEGQLNLLDNEPAVLDIDTKGAKFMTLKFIDGSSTYGDHISMGNAAFEYDGVAPVMVTEEEMNAPEPKKCAKCAQGEGPKPCCKEGVGHKCGQPGHKCDKPAGEQCPKCKAAAACPKTKATQARKHQPRKKAPVRKNRARRR